MKTQLSTVQSCEPQKEAKSATSFTETIKVKERDLVFERSGPIGWRIPHFLEK